MGFTKDGLPLVGRVPEKATGRTGRGEWIAAGFGGYGTGYCYSCGKAVAHMLLGREVSQWLPSAFVITEDRLIGGLAKGKYWEELIGADTIGEARSKL